MKRLLPHTVASPWSDTAPVREELFGVERLEQHAATLAIAQTVTQKPPRVVPLHSRLRDNGTALLAAYQASAMKLRGGGVVVPAAEWLLDNFHLVEEQLADVRRDLPPDFYRQLPKLAVGPFAGYPRVFGLTWAYVAHTDSHFDAVTLHRFITAYQQVQVLTIGELWATAITLRIVLIENLRRLADQITEARHARADADALADRLVVLGDDRRALEDDVAARAPEVLSEPFAAQLAKRLRNQDPLKTPGLGWLDERLQTQGSSIEEVVQHAQQRQGASHVSVRNVITSMKMISSIDWAEVFEALSLVDARLRRASDFGAMDFATRNRYRDAIEELARGAACTELKVAEQALQAALHTPTNDEPAQHQRQADPGYYLIAGGRPALEASLGFRPTLSLRLEHAQRALGIGGYVGAIVMLASLLLALFLSALALPTVGWLTLIAALAFIPATEVATAFVNHRVTRRFGPRRLPGLELKGGVPEQLRTLVVIPTLMSSEADLLEQLEHLEVHQLASGAGALSFALLTDFVDADTEVINSDAALLATAQAGIAALNQRYPSTDNTQRFLLLHRRRQFNAREHCWMGWERKRGKLHELNRLLRGATDTSFVAESVVVPQNVRYVITLDADTRLPRGAACKLIGKMAHPLNRPIFHAHEQRVVSGYGILQPRVTPTLPVGREGSLYQRLFSAPGGIDPYAAAVSDVYQDLFGEGSYTGKGIYDVDAFEAAMRGRVADNTLLSHDLFEGIFARAGLASDIEVIDDFPARQDVAAKRHHRWARGDWQLLPWAFSLRRGPLAMPAIGRLKLLDNLRRSLAAPSTVWLLGACWLLPSPSGVLIVLTALALPVFLPSLSALLPPNRDVHLRQHLRVLLGDLRQAAAQWFFALAFLADNAWRMADAIVRTLLRVFVTHRHLLEWTTAAQSSSGPRPTLSGYYKGMAGGVGLALVLASAALVIRPDAWALVLPFAALWLVAPLLALWASRAPVLPKSRSLADSEAQALRRIARRTWRYFETFVTPTEHMLPPDNFQEVPKPIVAHRTSPTNISLYLLSTVAARDFGWIGLQEAVARLEATFATLHQMPLYRGHFFNWYDTQDLTVLTPAYVSSVDSGNLAGHLIALAQACEEWCRPAQKQDLRPALGDTLALAMAALHELLKVRSAKRWPLLARLEAMAAAINRNQSADDAQLWKLLDDAEQCAQSLADADATVHLTTEADRDLIYWLNALRRTLEQHEQDRNLLRGEQHDLAARLQTIADQARRMALAMDFGFLLNPERQLLSIGYSLADNRLDPGCYDLLASEARLASLFAIAKGDAKTSHWFHLGRAGTPLGRGSALISWSGSMFEYLMPALVLRSPVGSLLEQTSVLIVARQQGYGRELGIPWGVSESAYNARDIEFTYQYSNFGVPGLGLKRGLAENRVIAPYASGLAAMVDAPGAHQNFARMEDLGALGRYGFYEALDYTRTRVPEGEAFAIVKNFMAHHQGMTIVALANTLLNGQMRARFHREPMIQACELLLQERMPRHVAFAHPRAEAVPVSATEANAGPNSVRRFTGSALATPVRPTTHLLSNGRYAVMLTAAGSGYSRWRDWALTRWREDATCDDWGSYVFLRDRGSGQCWSASAQPLASDPERFSDSREVSFGEDHAQFSRRDGSLSTTLDVLVSGEDDGEVRRVTLTNRGRRARAITLTSYAELVLAAAAADDVHPAFSKLFVQTEYLAEFGALIATRRPRSNAEPRIWAAHFVVVEGEVLGAMQYESDRAKFIGRSRRIGNAAALTDEALSNTVGTVLDPIFSLRQSVRIAAGSVAILSFWTVVAESRAALLTLIDQHHDKSAYERAKTLAWTQAQVQLRHLGVTATEAAEFQRLAAPILYSDLRFRSSAAVILRGAGPQSGLWSQSISGDLPIVLLRIDDLEDMAQVQQLLRAHEYWRMKRLAVDLVIVNERAASYVQDLQIAIETAVRSSQSRPRLREGLAQGAVHVVRADLMPAQTRALLLSVARVVLSARSGSIADQLVRVLQAPSAPMVKLLSSPLAAGGWGRGFSQDATSRGALPVLECFNGLGGFALDGREYVTVLDTGKTTPAPWINVIANPGFGFQVSTEGSGATWAENSRENRLTPWSNDPVSDGCGEALWVRDEESLQLFCATALPVRDSGRYVARHGFGYSRFEHEANGIALELLQFVPLADPVKISRLRLRNLSGRRRRLSVTSYAEWVLGTVRGISGPFIVTQIDVTTGALLARNPWNRDFVGRVGFADLGGEQTSWTADRSGLLGRHGSLAAPAALTSAGPLRAATGAGLDPCAAMQRVFDLASGESLDVLSLLGQGNSIEHAGALVTRYRAADIEAALAEVSAYWSQRLGTVQVKTPDRAMDILLNGWLLYQTIACRLWARSAFYQSSGAYGFRDQLQDGMALSFAAPEETRTHLLRAAGRQFVQGDVQHWWLPHSGQGVRTRISDDRVWLAFAAATYINSSGDAAVLDVELPFLEGQSLLPEEHDAFFTPQIAEESASLFEHCARGLDQCIALSGAHGLPLIGTGDWNDGMSRVGAGGQGESVWLGWLLSRTIDLFAPLAETRDASRALHWREHAQGLRAAIERDCWDGAWYRRATFDDGTWLGSQDSTECRIDSIAQSWAVLSGAADPQRAATAMASLQARLIDRERDLALLFTPPFDYTPQDPGYIKGYPPGLRENGGQYSHAAMWTIFAHTKLGQGDEAAALFALLNPINHARSPADAARYKVEPYVIAADVYSVAPHAGRGGWTWYTGAAGWMYRAALEGILGLRREGDTLVIEPCIPAAWPGYSAIVHVESSRYEIHIERGARDGFRGFLDEVEVPCTERGVRVVLDGRAHALRLVIAP